MINRGAARTISRVALENSPAPGAWVRRAACRGLPTDRFFSDDPVQTDAARAVCRDCAVRDDCAAYAMALPGIGGIWGGLSETDRRRIRRRRGRHSGATAAGTPKAVAPSTGCRSEAPRCRT
ncbi:MAG: WhiB family transcriptional regulator [Actinomycetota bacterium]|jgi:WhiB family transcriptional regulator, redox-sensing transcriptional regulator